MTDNRSNEPTEVQIEAAAKVLLRDYQWQYDGGEVSEFLDVARAALVAAQEAAPVPPSDVDEDKLAEVLETHRYKGMGWCECGENVNVRDGHRRHVARAVVAYLRGES